MIEIEKDMNENVDDYCSTGKMNEKKRLAKFFITSASGPINKRERNKRH